MAENLEADSTSWERTAKDLVAGAAGGVAQVLLGEMFAVSLCLTVHYQKSEHNHSEQDFI